MSGDSPFGTSTEVPVWSLWDQQDQDTLQAARDKSNFDAGARFSNAYFERAYGYQAGDLLPSTSAAPVATPNPAFAESASLIDPVQPVVQALLAHGAPLWRGVLAQVQTLVDQAPDVASLQHSLTQAYGGLETEQLVKLMAAALALAELKGMDDARV